MCNDVKTKILEDPMSVLEIDNPSNDIIDKAIKADPEIINFFISDNIVRRHLKLATYDILKTTEGLSDSLLKTIIYNDYRLIGKVNDPSEILQILAINRNPRAIFYIVKPTPNSVYRSIHLLPKLIKYFNNDDVAAQLTAITSEPKSISYIRNPHESIQRRVISKHIENISLINNISPIIINEAIDKYGVSVFHLLKNIDAETLKLIKGEWRKIK